MDNDLIEHEIDHVFVGRFDGEPIPNPDEVDDYAWVDFEDMLSEVSESSENFTYWFRLLIDIVKKYVMTSA